MPGGRQAMAALLARRPDIAGPLANHFGVSTILIATGTLTFIAACASLTVKSVRNLSNA